MRQERSKQVVGIVLFALALAGYLITLSPGAFPGLFARLLVTHAGIDPFLPMSNIVWSGLVRLVDLLPFSTLALKMNILSAVFGALCVWMLYRFMLRLDYSVLSRSDHDGVTGLAAIVGAAGAACCLGISVPFWMVSTRAHPATFDLLLFFACIALVLRYQRRPDQGRLLYGLAALYGLGVTEYATLIIAAPFVLLAMVYLVWQGGQLRARTVLVALLCFLVGTAPYYLYGWFYLGSDVAHWRAFERFTQVIWYLWRDEYRAIAKSMPQVGWLLLLMTTALPLVLTLPTTMARKGPGHQRRPGTHFLYAALTVLAVALLLNSRVAPWHLFVMQPLLVMPYVLIACWTGYLIGFWFVVLYSSRTNNIGIGEMIRKSMKPIYIPSVAVLLVVAALRNAESANGRAAVPVLQMTQQVVASCQGRPWLVSNGVLDDNIVLAARDKRIDLHVINASVVGNDVYLRYVSSLLESPRLRSVAHLGLMPLLNTWISQEPGAERQVAVLDSADLWLANGFYAVPNLVLFLGARDISQLDAEALYQLNAEYWDAINITTEAAPPPEPVLGGWWHWAPRHLSKVANNLGVLLEDLEQPAQADAAYRAALRFEPENVSTLLNQLTMAQAAGDEAQVAQVEARLNDVVEHGPQGRNIWSLARTSGYVRDAHRYVARGWAWSVSGTPRQFAEAEGQQSPVATAAGSSDAVPAPTVPDEAEEQLRERLAAAPEDKGLILGLARVLMVKKEFPEARELLERLRKMGVPRATLDMEQVALESLAGNTAAARKLLEGLVKDDPSLTRAWATLARLGEQTGDRELTSRALTGLNAAQAVNPIEPTVALQMAETAMRFGEAAQARGLITGVLAKYPNNIPALETLVRIDTSQAKWDLVQETVSRLLQVDPANAIGNHGLAMVHIARHDYTLAEVALRTCIEKSETPDALNNLAWVLMQREAYSEASEYAQKALMLNNNSADTWDTYGMAQLHLGNVSEAEKAILKALELRPGQPEMILHMAQIYEQKGMNQEALDLVDQLLDRAAEMSPEAFDEVRALVKKLRGE